MAGSLILQACEDAQFEAANSFRNAGDEEYWVMFKEAYTAALRYYKMGPWYINADIWGGAPTQRQFTSLQSFWPGARPSPIAKVCELSTKSPKTRIMSL
jgi:hypothetical protein